jgi:hypothetical protein
MLTGGIDCGNLDNISYRFTAANPCGTAQARAAGFILEATMNYYKCDGCGAVSKFDRQGETVEAFCTHSKRYEILRIEQRMQLSLYD